MKQKIHSCWRGNKRFRNNFCVNLFVFKRYWQNTDQNWNDERMILSNCEHRVEFILIDSSIKILTISVFIIYFPWCIAISRINKLCDHLDTSVPLSHDLASIELTCGNFWLTCDIVRKAPFVALFTPVWLSQWIKLLSRRVPGQHFHRPGKTSRARLKGHRDGSIT